MSPARIRDRLEYPGVLSALEGISTMGNAVCHQLQLKILDPRSGQLEFFICEPLVDRLANELEFLVDRVIELDADDPMDSAAQIETQIHGKRIVR